MEQGMRKSNSLNQTAFRKRKLLPNNTSPLRSQFRKYKPNALCSLAQFNNVGSAKNREPDQRLSCDRPLRIKIPAFFNVPRHEDVADVIREPLTTIHHSSLQSDKEPGAQDLVYLTSVNYQQPKEQPPGMPAATIRRINDLKLLSKAMKREKNLKEQARGYYSSGVLLENVGNVRKAIDEYEKFLRIALFLHDKRSIELVLNSMGVAYMMLHDYTSALEYHEKQTELSDSEDKFIGLINQGICRQNLNQTQIAFQKYRQAHNLAELQASKQRRWLAKEFILKLEKKLNNHRNSSPTADSLRQTINHYLEGVNGRNSPQQMVESYIGLGEAEAMQHNYASSRLKYAKALELGYLNQEEGLPKKAAGSKEILKKAKLGYAITTAQNRMEVFLKTFQKNLQLYKLA